MIEYTDEEIVRGIELQDDAVTSDSFHNFRASFISFIQSTFGCDQKKADDIYPESFAILYANVRKRKLVLPLQSSLKTYLFSVGKHLFHKRYYDKYQKNTVAFSSKLDVPAGEMVDQAMEEKEQAHYLRSILKSVGDPCQKLLELFYYQNYSFEAIANELGENEGRLRKRKYDCLKKIHKLMATKKTVL